MIVQQLRRTLVAATLALAVLLLTSTGRTQDALPRGEDLMDGFVKATGGEQLHRKFKTRVAKGTMTAPGGINGPLSIYQKAPNFLVLEADLQGLKIEMGTDGKVAWEINPLTGAKLKTGDARDSAIREANFYADVEWRKIYKSAKTVGEEKVKDVPCYKVELITHGGKTVTKYLDKDKGLIVKIVASLEGPEGKIQAENFIEDYKKVDGLLYPHKIETRAAGQNLVISLTKVEHDVDIPEGRFAIPEAVKKLIKE